MTRIFISIDMPELVREQIKKIQEKLPEFRGKFTEPKNLHLTLKFLGEIGENKLEGVKEKLKDIKYSSFETEVKYVGFFDNRKKGKRYGPIWLHLTNCNALQKEIDDKLKELFDKERRFMSHLTIARVKKIGNRKKFLKKLKEIKIPEIKFIVKNFKLKKSILTKQGPIYEDIENYDLI